MGHLYKNSIELEVRKGLVTSWPSISSTTDEKVLPNTWKEKEEVNKMSEEDMMPTWASLVGLAVSLTNELERVSQRKSSLSSHCWISPCLSSPLRLALRRSPGRGGPGGTTRSRQSRKKRLGIEREP